MFNLIVRQYDMLKVSLCLYEKTSHLFCPLAISHETCCYYFWNFLEHNDFVD